MPIDWSKFAATDTKQALPFQVRAAFQKAGLSLEGAKVMAAEIGRENDFNPATLFGAHVDPHNKQINIGMMSWQKDRGEKLRQWLEDRGLFKGGKIVQGQQAIDAMAEFAVQEMPKRLKETLGQPVVDYGTAVKQTADFIGWRANDPKYAQHHTRRDTYYQQVGGKLPSPMKNAGATQAPVDWSKFTLEKQPNGEGVDWSRFELMKEVK